ncbi:MAG TPA: HEAT repeat domain-containing protein [Pyrinomonadaceae bacterium]
MKHFLLLCIILILLAHNFSAQDKPKLIGEIEFFGYAGIDPDKVRAVLPFHEQENFVGEEYAGKLEQAYNAIKSLTGRYPTGINNVCCDKRGNEIIFIGLSGKTIPHRPKPNGTARLPEKILEMYERFMKALFEGVQKGNFPEDRSKGYALAEYPPQRAVQLEMRAYAVNHGALLRSVLETSSEDQQRIVAAMLLGYARQSDAQLASLIKATEDSNDTVRNNATRALLVLAASSAKIAGRIPVKHFIELLLSGTWSDLNKSSGLLDFITAKSRDAKTLAQLSRKDILERLIEMARWRSHWESAAKLLGRVAGINEQQLMQLVADGKAEVIIKEVQDKLGRGL